MLLFKKVKFLQTYVCSRACLFVNFTERVVIYPCFSEFVDASRRSGFVWLALKMFRFPLHLLVNKLTLETSQERTDAI